MSTTQLIHNMKKYENNVIYWYDALRQTWSVKYAKYCINNYNCYKNIIKKLSDMDVIVDTSDIAVKKAVNVYRTYYKYHLE